MKRFLIALAMGASIATIAQAADLGRGMKDTPRSIATPEVQGTDVSDVNWGGVYVGAHAGYAWGEMDATRSVSHNANEFKLSSCSFSGTDAPATQFGLSQEECAAAGTTVNPSSWYNPDRTSGNTNTTGRFDDKPILFDDARQHANIGMDGWFGGVDLSYKIMMTNRMILEPFADLSYGGGKGHASFDRDVVVKNVDGDTVTELSGITETSQVSFEKRWGGTLGLKGGALLTSRDYVYALGGLAYGSFNVKGGSQGHHDTDDIDVTSYNDTTSGWGYTVGAGYEHALTDRLHLGVEGRYTAIDGLDASNSSSFDIPTNESGSHGVAVHTNEKISGDYGEWSVLGRISYKFGGGN